MSKRKKYSAEFKAKVALEAIKGEETMAQLSAKYGVHPNMIAQWKSKAQKGMVEVFSTGKARQEKSHEDEVKELHAKIGQLTVERDFLSKAFGR
jgi:transposase